MHYKVTVEPSYLKVEVYRNDTPGEAKELLYAVSEAVFKHGRKPILVCAPGAKPLALPDLYVLARYVIDTPLRHGKIGFVYDTDHELASNQFIEELGVRRGLDLGVFPTETEAIAWLTAPAARN
jgi:hypothetical protein